MVAASQVVVIGNYTHLSAGSEWGRLRSNPTIEVCVFIAKATYIYWERAAQRAHRYCRAQVNSALYCSWHSNKDIHVYPIALAYKNVTTVGHFILVIAHTMKHYKSVWTDCSHKSKSFEASDRNNILALTGLQAYVKLKPKLMLINKRCSASSTKAVGLM